MRKNLFKILVASALFAAFASAAGAQAPESYESEGEKLFKTNNPLEAIGLLEQDIANQTVSDDTYNFLGLAYFQTGDFDSAIAAFEKGIKAGKGNAAVLLFNEGNVAYAKGDFALAEQCYSRAYTIDGGYHAALLNRANTRLNLEKYLECLNDYKKYIELLPDDEQSEKIRLLIAYLETEYAEEIAAALYEPPVESVDLEDEEQLAAVEEEVLDELDEEAVSISADDERQLAQSDSAEEETFGEEAVRVSPDDERLLAEQDASSDEEALLADAEGAGSDANQEEAVRFSAEDEERIAEQQRRWKQEDLEEREAELAAREAAIAAKEAEARRMQEIYRAYSDGNYMTAEERKAAEEERRKKLLEDVANSLQMSNTSNVSEGTEDVLDYEHESELE